MRMWIIMKEMSVFRQNTASVLLASAPPLTLPCKWHFSWQYSKTGPFISQKRVNSTLLAEFLDLNFFLERRNSVSLIWRLPLAFMLILMHTGFVLVDESRQELFSFVVIQRQVDCGSLHTNHPVIISNHLTGVDLTLEFKSLARTCVETRLLSRIMASPRPTFSSVTVEVGQPERYSLKFAHF